MRMSEFNKHLIHCLFCGKGKVKRASQRCEHCKQTAKKTDPKGAIVGHREPAAILDVEGVGKVFVDSQGREVQDHGYDLEHDHHGWQKNGYKKPKTEFI